MEKNIEKNKTYIYHFFKIGLTISFRNQTFSHMKVFAKYVKRTRILRSCSKLRFSARFIKARQRVRTKLTSRIAGTIHCRSVLASPRSFARNFPQGSSVPFSSPQLRFPRKHASHNLALNV